MNNKKISSGLITVAFALSNSFVFGQVVTDTMSFKMDSLNLLNKSGNVDNALKKNSSLKKRDTENRNVMLNAGSATTPRQLNIGLPFTGDILILENEVPVVYTFWTQIPTTVWRYDSTLGRMGLMSFQDGALTFGKVGYIVTSWDREPGNKFKGFASTYVNNFGSFRYDASVTGPIGKKGWGYMIGLNQTYDRGSGIEHKFTPYSDRVKMLKAGMSKKYKNGNVRMYYKHADARAIIGDNNPIVYNGEGKTKVLDGFRLGQDSYLSRDGSFPYYDYNTGEAKMGDLSSDEASRNLSDAIYLLGEHRFKNGWKLNYSNMYMHSKAALAIQMPLSLMVSDPDQRTPGEVYTYAGTTNKYDGSVQLVSNQYYPQVKINTWISRMEFTKKVKNHNLRAGATYQYYRAPELLNSGLYYQTVEPNPQRLDRYADVGNPNNLYAVTQDGLLPSDGIGSYKLISIKKLGLYFSDDIKLNNRFDVGFGARIERQDTREKRSPYINQFVLNRELTDTKFNNKWNKVGYLNFVAKVTNNFGFVGDATYNDWFGYYFDYQKNDVDDLGNPKKGALQNIAKELRQSVINYGGGIYWNNGDIFSIVSKITRIYKKNNTAASSIVNPSNTQEQAQFNNMFYDISTLGWTTDIVSKPFKNFHFHYLLTIQQPKYKKYSYSAFGVTYDYSDMVIPELSKVLMEIDPSYFMLGGDLKLWLSLRYFGKQYGNKTNAFWYKGWLESFGGINYKMNRNVDFGFQVVNIFNQTGIKGALIGADQITNEMVSSQFIGRKIIAGSIRPRTFELTVNYKF